MLALKKKTAYSLSLTQRELQDANSNMSVLFFMHEELSCQACLYTEVANNYGNIYLKHISHMIIIKICPKTFACCRNKTAAFASYRPKMMPLLPLNCGQYPRGKKKRGEKRFVFIYISIHFKSLSKVA